MLTYKDCLGMCDCTEEEISAIAEHEQISDMAAVLMAAELIHRRGGALVIQQIILDDILKAREADDAKQTERWCNALEHFVTTHRENMIRFNGGSDLGLDQDSTDLPC